MSDRTKDAIVTAVVGVGLLVLLRVVLGVFFNHYVERVARRKSPDYVARLRTRLVVLRRVLVAFVFVVVVWSVLEIFPATEQIARTLLASGAVVALFVGVAFSVPLGNIGAGILLSITQPVRIGDRISVGDVTGTAEEITLIHTVVRTDAGLTAFVPNSQLVTSTVVNRTIEDPRRLVSVRLPIGHAASIDAARSTLLETARELDDPRLEDASVAVAEVAETVTWLSVSGYLPYGSSVERVAARLREQCLVALARERLLPA
jgi:small-conductance mechanosensitive channel